jgi:hypothetical protein
MYTRMYLYKDIALYTEILVELHICKLNKNFYFCTEVRCYIFFCNSYTDSKSHKYCTRIRPAYVWPKNQYHTALYFVVLTMKEINNCSK